MKIKYSVILLALCLSGLFLSAGSAQAQALTTKAKRGTLPSITARPYQPLPSEQPQAQDPAQDPSLECTKEDQRTLDAIDKKFMTMDYSDKSAQEESEKFFEEFTNQDKATGLIALYVKCDRLPTNVPPDAGNKAKLEEYQLEDLDVDSGDDKASRYQIPDKYKQNNKYRLKDVE